MGTFLFYFHVLGRAFINTVTFHGWHDFKILYNSALVLVSWFFVWSWYGLGTMLEEITIATSIVYAVGIGFILVFVVNLIRAPAMMYLEEHALAEQLRADLAKQLPDLMVSQLRGHGDNIAGTVPNHEPWFVRVRDVVVVNRSDKDEIVSFKLWVPLDNGTSVDSTPQTSLPPGLSDAFPAPGLETTPLLSPVENIPSRRSIRGDLIFRVPRSTVPKAPDPSFLTIIIKAELTGVERAVNSLAMTEVVEPYPRTLEELNDQIRLSTQ